MVSHFVSFFVFSLSYQVNSNGPLRSNASHFFSFLHLIGFIAQTKNYLATDLTMICKFKKKFASIKFLCPSNIQWIPFFPHFFSVLQLIGLIAQKTGIHLKTDLPMVCKFHFILSKKEAPIGVPGTSIKECAHPSGWRDKHKHKQWALSSPKCPV